MRPFHVIWATLLICRMGTCESNAFPSAFACAAFMESDEPSLGC
jgi:hypothetical protein